MTMAYFSNGTEGDIFRERNCDLCVHDLHGICPVWGLHLSRNYDQCEKTPLGTTTKDILASLIPEDADGFARNCSLFHPYTAEEKHEAGTEENRLAGTYKPAPWIEEWLATRK